MIQTIQEMLQYTFITRAIIVGCLVSLCAALLGVSLVLKRYAMIGDRLISCRIWNINSCSCIWMGTITNNNTMCCSVCNYLIKNR